MSLTDSPVRDHPKRLACTILGLAAVVTFTTAASCDPDTSKKPAAKATTQGDIPGDYQTLYQAAPLCSGLSWQVLAAVGKIETDHGRSSLPGVHSGKNSAKAMGPMQFLGPTFAGVRKRHPDVGANIYDPAHAIPAAAYKLCDDGGNKNNIRKALFAYNHSTQYVNDVLAQARKY